MSKYWTFYVDNQDDPHKICRAMHTLDIEMATYDQVSSMKYGLILQAGGRVVIEGYIHFYEKHDLTMVTVNLPDFHLWPARYRDTMQLHTFFRQGQCMFTKSGGRQWDYFYDSSMIKFKVDWYYAFQM